MNMQVVLALIKTSGAAFLGAALLGAALLHRGTVRACYGMLELMFCGLTRWVIIDVSLCQVVSGLNDFIQAAISWSVPSKSQVLL